MKAIIPLVAIVSILVLPKSGMTQDSPNPGHNQVLSTLSTPEATQEMHDQMQSADKQLDSLLNEMNGSTGEKKIEAMAALLNRLVQQRRATERHMNPMQMEMMRKDDAKSGTTQSATVIPNERQQRLVAEDQFARAKQAVAEALREKDRLDHEIAEAREEAAKARAEAVDTAARALAERDASRREAERAIAEARAMVEKTAISRQEAQQQISEALKQVDLARAAEKRALEAREQALVEAKRAAAAEQARRESERKSESPDRPKPALPASP